MDFLQVKNGKIVDQSGTEVYLRGTCVGGWMNMEDFINGYPGTESGMKREFAKAMGAGKAELFFEKILDNFLNEDDIRFIGETGANCIRIPLSYKHFEDDMKPFVYKEEGFKRLDRILDACEQEGIYVILDMHALAGWQNCHWHSDNERGAVMLWKYRHFQERIIALWEEFAKRYRDRSAVAGYDLMNEPSTGTPTGEHAYDFYEFYQSDWDAINRLYREIGEAVRKIDKRHILFLEGDNYSRDFAGLDAPFEENLVYSSHNYIPPGYGPGKYPGYYDGVYWDKNKQENAFLDHQGTRFAMKHHVPLWVGEFGSQYHGYKEEIPYRLKSMEDQLGIYNAHGVHWTTWTYKDPGIMGWVFLDPDSEYMKIIQPVQEQKRILGAENFVADYAGVAEGRRKSRVLADYILDVMGETRIDRASNAFVMNYGVLNGYAGAMLQPAYARRFRGYGEDSLERIAGAFKLENCVKNEGYLEVLKGMLH